MRNKGRAFLAVRAARGNLGTIALVNGQFLFWLVSKGTGKPTSAKVKGYGYSIRRDFAISLSISNLFFLRKNLRSESSLSY